MVCTGLTWLSLSHCIGNLLGVFEILCFGESVWIESLSMCRLDAYDSAVLFPQYIDLAERHPISKIK